jgi:hypothetical protein
MIWLWFGLGWIAAGIVVATLWHLLMPHDW